MPGTFLYFAYGPNMFARRLAARTPSAARITTAFVEGHRLEDVLKICGTGTEKRKLPEVLTNDLGSVKSALAKHLGAIEDRFSKFQIGSTEKSLNAIEQEESEAVVARIFGKKRPIRSKVG